MRAAAAVLAAAALLLAGCGGGPDTSTPEGTIKAWLLEGGCDRMTDKFLEEQVFIGDTREERCDLFEKQFTKPAYDEGDIEVTDVEVDGDRATARVGGGGVDITSKYELLKQDGKWRIDAAEIE